MRVVYEYHCDVEGAGNVSRIRRMTPTGQPDEYTVAGTSFAYNKMSELWITSHRTWDEVRTTQGGIDVTVNNLVVKDIVEFRGVGRQRWMMRARDTTAPYDPDPDTAVWTDYAGNAPLYDYTVSFDTATPPNITENHKDYYSLGMAQMDETGVVMYTHANHLGSTRAMTNEATPPTVQRTFTYTAFGEIVGEAGTFETRYQYAGGNGNETFGDFGPSFSFPFIHVGSNWYDPQSSRFLQGNTDGASKYALPVSLLSNGPPKQKRDRDCFCRRDYTGHSHSGPPIQRPTVLDKWVADRFLDATGGDDSWLDRKRTVKRVQRYVKIPATVTLWCTPTGRLAKIAQRGAVILGWLVDELRDYFGD